MFQSPARPSKARPRFAMQILIKLSAQGLAILGSVLVALSFALPSASAWGQAINCPSGWNGTTGACGVSTNIQSTGYPFAWFGDNTPGIGRSGSNFILQVTGVQHAPNSLDFETPVNVRAFTSTFQFKLDSWNLVFVLENATHNAGGGAAPGFTIASGFSGGAGSEEGFYQAFGGVGNPPPNNIFALNIDSANLLVNSETPYYNNAQIYQQVQSPSIPDDGQAWFYYTNKQSTSPVQLSNISGTVCTPVLNGSCIPSGGASTPDTFSATVIYTGNNVTLNLYDVTAGGTCSPVTSGTCFSYTWPNVPIPSWVDGTTAYASLGSANNANPPNNLVLESWVYTVLSAASTPTLSPTGGTYGSTQSVTISGPSGSAICYNTTGAPSTNGLGACINGTPYTGAISVAKGQTIYAVAGAGSTNYGDSAVGNASYNITGSASTPVFNQPGGTWQGNQTVQLTTAQGGVICYNTTGSPATNGSTGCTTGTLYSTPITVSSNETLYAVAGGTGFTDSGVGSASYVISPFAVVGSVTGSYPANSPTFSPLPGTYSGAQSVALSTTTSGANICYILSATTPTLLPEPDSLGGCSVGTRYSGPITVSSSQNLYAAAGTTVGANVAGTGPPSSVVQGAYTISPSGGSLSPAPPTLLGAQVH
jgi:hypothetical protein